MEDRKKERLPYSIAVLVLGIASIMSGGGLVLGIIALVLARKGYKKYNASPELYNGLDMLRAGQICAIIGVVLRSLVILAVILAIIIACINGTWHFSHCEFDGETLKRVLHLIIDNKID